MTTRYSSTRKMLARVVAATLAFGQVAQSVHAASTDLADMPMVAKGSVPPNMMLTLSVEWPTGTVAAYNDNTSTVAGQECPGRDGGIGVCYFESRTYLGYFDPTKCYTYDSTNNYFVPSSTGTGTYQHQCTSKWSGNFLNWATMHALDEFRYAMTGGDRYIDTSTLTVIEKAYHNGEGGYGQFPRKRVRDTAWGTVPAVAPSTVTPKTWSNLYVRVTNNTTPISKSGVANSEGRVMQISSASDFSSSVETYLVRVKVCDSSVGLESNCRQYGSSWKPTGLIQQNADKMRFGVTAYLNDDSQDRPGGIIRSRMKFVGPNNIVPNSTPTSNANAEISSDGTLVANPDSADATASGVSNSGVINYLNKFGKPSASYKSYDTLSEMFYEATRYMRNLPNTPAYTSGTITDTMKDGFPVITNWTSLDQSNVQNRPIQYACQKTFFVGIADSNAWCDSYIPGNRAAVRCGGRTGTLTDEHGIQVSDLDDEIGNHEGVASLGTWIHDAGWGRYNTFHLGGLAFWANTRDILPDDNSKPWTIGKQTAQSYWVDVRETGSSEYPWNQMWAAAKYGGFEDKRADKSTVRNLVTNPLQTGEWDSDSDNVPDNYFTGERPDKLIASLNNVFQSVIDKTFAGAAVAVANADVAVDNTSYSSSYNSGNWSGDLVAYPIDTTTGAVNTASPIWATSAQAQLDLRTAASRKIVTYTGTSGTGQGIQFQPTSAGTTTKLSSAQQTLLNSPSLTDGATVLAYLRGDRAGEGTTYRTRTHVLGDIINAEAVVVGVPVFNYGDTGYSTFKTNQASRTKVVFQGANDGMLHAFTASSGAENWAYIPNLLMGSLNNLSRKSGFTHKFYVDGTPVVGDIDFNKTNGASGAADWHTILVGGLGKGGRGYYALDVTTPTATDEADAATKVMWEFPNSATNSASVTFTSPSGQTTTTMNSNKIGYSFGKPIIVKTKAHGWVALVTSGYNNGDSTSGSDYTGGDGHGYLFVLNAKTGALLHVFDTGAGSAATPSGLAHISAYVENGQVDNTVQYAYGGDLQGNVWRFDMNNADTAQWKVKKLATLVDAAGTPQAQPITTEPELAKIVINGVEKRFVYVGTGKYLGDSDVSTTQTQTMYALVDDLSNPAGDTAVITPLRSNLQQQTLTTSGTTRSSTENAVNYSTKKGWYVDLPASGERVNTNPVLALGALIFTSNIPNTDVCTPGGSSWLNVFDYKTGSVVHYVDPVTSQTVWLSNSLGNALASRPVLIQITGGKVKVLIRKSDATTVAEAGPPTGGTTTSRRVSWKEITGE